MNVLSNLDFGSVARIVNLLDAVSAQEPVTLAQFNALIEGLAFKDDVRCATTANINIASPGTTIDGLTMAVNDRVLLRGQTTASQNGIYIFNGSAVAMTRAADMSISTEFNSAIVPVVAGTDAGLQWRQTAINPTVGTTSIVFVSFGTSAPSASETTAGIAEIATQAETDAGTDDLRMVTPLKLATTSLIPKSYKTNIGDGSSTTYTITHNLGIQDVHVTVFYNGGNFDTIIVDTRRPTGNTIQLLFATAPSTNQFRVLVTRA